jgi:chromosome segregation ATPase
LEEYVDVLEGSWDEDRKELGKVRGVLEVLEGKVKDWEEEKKDLLRQLEARKEGTTEASLKMSKDEPGDEPNEVEMVNLDSISESTSDVDDQTSERQQQPATKSSWCSNCLKLTSKHEKALEEDKRKIMELNIKAEQALASKAQFETKYNYTNKKVKEVHSSILSSCNGCINISITC